MFRRWDKSKPPRGAFTRNLGSDRAQGLVAWYPFGGATLARDFVGTNHMAFSGGRAELDAYNGSALRLNGTSDYAFTTTPIVTTYPVTMSAWVNPSSLAVANVIVGVSSHTSGPPLMLLELTTGGAGFWAVRNDLNTGSFLSTANTTTTNKWAFVIGASGSATDHAASLNGGTVATASTSVTTPFTLTRIVLGAALLGSTTPSNFVVGAQAETCFWNVRKTNQEMQLYADPSKRFELWYPLRSPKWISFPSASITAALTGVVGTGAAGTPTPNITLALSGVAATGAVGSVLPRGIQFDAASNSGYQAASASYTFNRTVTGDDRYLAVDIALLSVGQTVASAIDDFGGGNVAMVFLGARSTVTSFGRVESWGLAAPATGTKSIQITLSGIATSVSMAVSYTGVKQATPTEGFNTAQATDTGSGVAEVSITTVADRDWLHSAIATNDTSVIANSGSRNNVSGVGGSGADQSDGPYGAGVHPTQAGFYDIDLGATWALTGYGIVPIGAPPPIMLMGVEAIGSPGSLAPVITLALSGVSGTAAVGTLSPGESLALTGVAGTGDTGLLAVSASFSLAGVAGTGSVGMLYPEISLTGVEGTGAVGEPVPGFSLGLSGVSGTGSVGTLVPSSDLSIALTGVSATGAAGTLVPGITKEISGVLASGAVGSLFAGGAVLGITIDSPIILTPTILGGTIRPDAGGYLANDGSPGINTTITTGSLVGKTITVKDGLIVNFS